MIKILIESKRNAVPEKEIQDRLDFLGGAWNFVSAITTGVHCGDHVQFVTTVVLKQNKKFRPTRKS